MYEYCFSQGGRVEAIRDLFPHFLDKRFQILVYIVGDMERTLRLMERWKDTEAPMTLKGMLDTASPSEAVHVGPWVASGVWSHESTQHLV